jgi:zinc protease
MKRTLLLCALIACGGSKPHEPVPAPPVGDTTPPPKQDAPPERKMDPDAVPMPLWSEVHKGTLSNGLTYYIMKHGKPEKRVMMWLAVNAGSVDEDEDQRGLAHYDEHMAFNGTKRFPHDDIVSYLQAIGMRFGADLNAYTTWQQTVYQLEVPTDKPEFIAKGFDILHDWAGDLAFDPGEVQKESGVVLEEWRLGRGAFMRLFDKHAHTLFKGSRYADRITIGLPEIIKKPADKDAALAAQGRAALMRFYKDWYRPDNMAVIVVGEIDPADMEKQIKAHFGDLKNPANERKKVPGGVPKAEGTRISIETDKELPTPSVEIYNLVPHRAKASRRDDRRLVVEQVYQTIINERLAQLRRKPDAPFLAAFTGMGAEVREIDGYTRQAQVKQGKLEEALRALLTESLRVERHGFTQAELDRARIVVKRNHEEGEAREATNDSRNYTNEITRNFFEGEFMIGAKAEKDLALEFLPQITVDELNANVKSYGGAENRVITVSIPEGQPTISEERVKQIVAEVEKSDIPAWEEKPIPTTLMAQPPAPGKVVKEKHIDAIDVTEWTLSNGARVIVKPTDYERDSVVLVADSPGGTALAANKDYGNARFASQVAGLGGVAEIDGDTLGKVLAGKQVSAFTSLGENSESVNASASPRDLETMFQLVYLRITAPRKDVEQFKVWQANSAEQITNQQRSPEFQFSRNAQEALYNNNPRRNVPKPEDYAKLDYDKAMAFYKDRFSDVSDFTFVIVGEVDLAKLKPMVETYLASMPGKKRKDPEKDAGVRKVGGVVAKEWKLGIEPKASVQINFHADDTWSKDKDRDVYILGQALGMLLREAIREDKSGVYGIGANGTVFRSPHQERSFSISFGCDPQRVDELVKATQDVLDKVAKDGVDADHLEKIKNIYTRSRETELRQNRFWSSRLVNAYHYGDDPTEIPDTTKLLARVTSDNIKAAAKHFLDKKSVFKAVRMPEAAK